ncbi:MAG: single-stranded DNA-binding protein [Deltaproteobacteria bacterium]|jgi:single-strand DNA-binding protein|nr:single-stranded DNA-binding protein [Deltaproteobacteria bacterium]
MLNKVMLIGRLGKDPEVRYAANGTAIANLSVATDESYNDRDGNKVERTEWHTVVVFQRQAENCKTYLSKGSLIFVEGSLQTRKWQDKQGQDRYSTEIKANRVQFLDRKNSAQGMSAGSEDGPGPRSSGQGKTAKAQNDAPDDYGSPFPSEASGMDDVPF